MPADQQQIKNVLGTEDLDFDPGQVPQWFVTNAIQRCMAWLVAWYGNKLRRLQCTNTGILKVAETGTGFTYSVIGSTQFSAQNPGPQGQGFTSPIGRLEVFVWDYPLMLYRSPDPVMFPTDLQTPIEIPANTMYSFDAYTEEIMLMPKTAGSWPRYQYVGWY